MTDHSPLVERLRNHEPYLTGRSLETRAADAIEALEARVKELERVLKHISCPTQTEKLLWWQEAARAALAREPEKRVCLHNQTEEDWTYVRCKDCGAVNPDNSWGVAASRWHPCLGHAKFYQEHGRYPE